MTRDREQKSHTPNPDDPWKVTDELKEIIRKANEEFERMHKEFENKIVDCPTCGSPSKFVEYKGSYTRVRGLFRCENGHDFFEG